MVSIRCERTGHDDVTLVEVVVDVNGPDARYVELAVDVDGPLWPPRRQGRPEDGWSDGGYAGVFEPGTHGLGFATPATPADPPVTVATVAAPSDRDDDRTPDDVVREWGDPAPPRDAIPVGDASTDDGQNQSPPSERSDATTPPADTTVTPDDGRTDGLDRPDLPAPVQEWLVVRERRVARAERLQRATTAPEATAAVEDVGGVAALGDLAATLDDDRRALAAVRAAVTEVERRAAAVDVPSPGGGRT
ncbi:MAG: hypothetical protein ABEI96_06895 [Haloarculaceae archaeon]